MKKIFISVFFTSVFWVVIGLVVYKQFSQAAPESKPAVSLRTISEEERAFYKSKFVNIKAGGLRGSGCEYKPGYFLTALHVLIPSILDDDIISVNDKKATLVSKSKTREDYAILSTHADIDERLGTLPEHEFKEGEDVIIVGSPGDQVALVQPGKIINTLVMDETNVVKKSAKKVYTIYVESGISGGCVYPADSDIPVAVFTKKDGDSESRIGEISIASKAKE